MRDTKVAVSRPRVYLTGFSCAIELPPSLPQTVIGRPYGDSNNVNKVMGEYYMRPDAEEMLSNSPYNPFKVDVWQLFKPSNPAVHFEASLPLLQHTLY